jgi:hypothetical protein
VPECDREASKMIRPWPTRGTCAMEKNISFGNYRFPLIGNHMLYYHIHHLELLCTSAHVVHLIVWGLQRMLNDD